MYKYKNVSEVTQALSVSGNVNPRIVKPGEIVESDVAIENPNFEFQGDVNTPSEETNGGEE